MTGDNVLKFKPKSTHVRHKRRLLAAELRELASDVANKNYYQMDSQERRLIGAYHDGSVILDIGKGRALWCSPELEGTSLYSDDLWYTGEALDTLRVNDLFTARAHLREWRAAHL